MVDNEFRSLSGTKISVSIILIPEREQRIPFHKKEIISWKGKWEYDEEKHHESIGRSVNLLCAGNNKKQNVAAVQATIALLIHGRPLRSYFFVLFKVIENNELICYNQKIEQL